MSQRYRHRRTFSPGTAFPSPIEPGEIAVNTANRQIAVGDAAAGTLGVPLPLLGVRIFDARASYATNDYVVQGGSFYRAKSAINPGAFNASQWDVMSTDAALKAYADAGDAAVSAAFAAADTTKVAKAGDTMTGPLVLPVAAPTLDPQAANKKYVDDKIAAIPTPSSLTVSDTPPVGVPDGALWWESDSGLLYVRYNDGNTTQWVIAAPQPDINAFMTSAQAVRYDTAQSLSAPQQQQARQNIGSPAASLIINGDFRVNQVGYVSAAVLAAGAYGHDQWKAGASGGDYSFTQLKSSTQITIASGKSLIQPIEDVNVVGGSYVLSWIGTAQARAGINTLTPSGSYAGSPLLITGQTADTAMSVEFNNGTLGTVKLESGANATPFIMRPYSQELEICKRYLWVVSYVTNQFVAILQSPSATLANGPLLHFPVTMRASPTVAMSPSTASFVLQGGAGGGNALSALNIGSTPQSSYATFNTGGGLSVGAATALYATGPASLVFSARL